MDIYRKSYNMLPLTSLTKGCIHENEVLCFRSVEQYYVSPFDV
jgi:hypothetical protein